VSVLLLRRLLLLPVRHSSSPYSPNARRLSLFAVSFSLIYQPSLSQAGILRLASLPATRVSVLIEAREAIGAPRSAIPSLAVAYKAQSLARNQRPRVITKPFFYPFQPSTLWRFEPGCQSAYLRRRCTPKYLCPPNRLPPCSGCITDAGRLHSATARTYNDPCAPGLGQQESADKGLFWGHLRCHTAQWITQISPT